MTNQTKLQKETTGNSDTDAPDSNKFELGGTRRNDAQKLKRIDDSAEMFRGLITGDEHYHSRGSTSYSGLW